MPMRRLREKLASELGELHCSGRVKGAEETSFEISADHMEADIDEALGALKLFGGR